MPTTTCPVCRSAFPAATLIDHFENDRRANESHPGQRCEKIKVDSEVTPA